MSLPGQRAKLPPREPSELFSISFCLSDWDKIGNSCSLSLGSREKAGGAEPATNSLWPLQQENPFGYLKPLFGRKSFVKVTESSPVGLLECLWLEVSLLSTKLINIHIHNYSGFQKRFLLFIISYLVLLKFILVCAIGGKANIIMLYI